MASTKVTIVYFRDAISEKLSKGRRRSGRGRQMNRELRSFRNRSRALLASVAHWLGNRSRELRPRAGDFGSLRICPSCGLITSKHKSQCLECGKVLKPA
jgi:hypothetical protein